MITHSYLTVVVFSLILEKRPNSKSSKLIHLESLDHLMVVVFILSLVKRNANKRRELIHSKSPRLPYGMKYFTIVVNQINDDKKSEMIHFVPVTAVVFIFRVNQRNDNKRGD